MNGEDILEIVKSKEKATILPYFRGIYSVYKFVRQKDAIMQTDKNSKNVYILHTASEKNPRGHWLTVLADPSKAQCFFVDPYGLHPNSYSVDLEERCKETGGSTKVHTLPFPLQSKNTHVCALYAIFFALHYCEDVGQTDFELTKGALEKEYGFEKGERSANDGRLVEYFQRRYDLTEDETLCLHEEKEKGCISFEKLLKESFQDSRLE